MLDFVIRVNKKYCPRILLEGCKYQIKKNKMGNIINDDFASSSSDESDDESDNESDNKSTKAPKNLRVINDESNDWEFVLITIIPNSIC